MHRFMRLSRLIDERMLALQRQGRIGFYGASIGQEAAPVATALAIEPNDWIFPSLREGAAMLVRGFPLVRFLAQLFGNDWDVLKGRQMPSHMSGRSVNQVSWSSCIGSQLPHAVGAAWAAKIRRESAVSIAFLGDGATSSADFHAALNFAAVFKVPCIFVCQNNQWAISTPLERQTAARSLADKARAYAMKSRRVDGNDVLAVYAVVSEAVDTARAGAGPSFVECITYRMAPHSSSDDPSRYQPQAEVRAWAERDPIRRLEAYLIEHGLADAASLAALEHELKREIESALLAVEGRPPPERATLFEDVYANPPWPLVEQRNQLLAVSARTK